MLSALSISSRIHRYILMSTPGQSFVQAAHLRGEEGPKDQLGGIQGSGLGAQAHRTSVAEAHSVALPAQPLGCNAAVLLVLQSKAWLVVRHDAWER